MKNIKRVVAVTVVACAAVAGAATITATNVPVAEGIVTGMTNPPELLFSSCLQPDPSRATLAIARTQCDVGAEKAGYNHGIFRPLHKNDDFVIKGCLKEAAAAVEGDPKDPAEPAPTEPPAEPAGSEPYVCLGVGGR